MKKISVVEDVDGAVIRTPATTAALPAADIERCVCGLIDMLASLHAVGPRAVGLDRLGQPTGYLARQIRRWHGQRQRLHTRTLKM